MPGDLGTIKGQMILDVKQALAAYTAARAAHLSTVTALSTGGAAMVLAGAGIAAVGVGIAAGIGYAVKAAAEFERKLDFFGAVSASTADQMDRVREKALQLGKDTIFSAGQIADSFVELGKSGVGAEDIINGIGAAVANLGAAADIPLDTAANIITSAVQTFGLSADQAVGVADKLAGAANASIVDVQDLGLSLKYAGGVAKGLGVSFDDTNTALALLGKYGIRGSTAGTSLRQVLISLTGTTDKAQKTLKELGIITEDGKNQFFDAQGSAKSLAEVFDILGAATAGLSDEEKLATLKTVFATRALPSVIALSKEGAAGFAEMQAEISKTTALEVASKRLDNLSGDIEILRGNLETMAIEAGSTMQKFARGVVQGLTQVVAWFTNLSTSTQEWIVKGAAIAAVVFIVVGALGIFAGSLLQIIGLFIRMLPAFKLIATAVKILTTSFIRLGVAMFANPIGLIILAVIALVAAFVLLWRNNEGFRNFFIQMWAKIKAAALTVANWFKGLPAFFSALWNTIKSNTLSIWNAVIGFFASIPQRIGAFFAQVGQIIRTLWNWSPYGLIINNWGKIISFFKALPGQIGDFLSRLPYLVGYWISFTIASIIRLWIEGWKLMINTGIAIVEGIISFFQQLPARLGAIIGATVAWVNQTWNSMYDSVVATAGKIVQGVVTFFTQLPGRVSALFQQVMSTVASWLGQTAATARSKAQEIWNNIVGFIQGLPSNVASTFSNVLSSVSNYLGQAAGKAREMASNIKDNLLNGIRGLPGAVDGILDNVISAIKGAIRGAFNAVKDFARGLWDGFKDGLGIHSPSFIERAMWQITDVVSTEADSLKRQVPHIQKLGAELDNMSFSPNTGALLNTTTEMANQIAAYQKMQNDLAKTASTAAIAPNASSLTTSGLRGSASGSSASSTPPAINAKVQVFVGDKEITDIVDTRVQVSLQETALGVSTGVWS